MILTDHYYWQMEWYRQLGSRKCHIETLFRFLGKKFDVIISDIDWKFFYLFLDCTFLMWLYQILILSFWDSLFLWTAWSLPNGYLHLNATNVQILHVYEYHHQAYINIYKVYHINFRECLADLNQSKGKLKLTKGGEKLIVGKN